MTKTGPSVAIIGAGLAGHSLAKMLENSFHISLYDKSRGVGGRMSTRYSNQYEFDHGAPFFTCRSKPFKQFLTPFLETGEVRQWTPRVMTLNHQKKPYRRDWFEPHYTAVPRMNALCKSLVPHEKIKLDTQITEIKKEASSWFLLDQNQDLHGPYDWVVCTAPAPQTAKLIPASFCDYGRIAETQMTGCYSLMLGFQPPLEIGWQAARVKDSSIDWIFLNSSKPGRPDACSLLLHSTSKWAQDHIEQDQQETEQDLTRELERILGKGPLPSADFSSLHRWRYAFTDPAADDESVKDGAEKEDIEREGFLIDRELQLGVCGDWLMQGSVESAFLSAFGLAEQMQRS